MQILLTGGTGFLGGAFIKKFPKNSYTVLTRKVPNQKNIANHVDYIQCLEEVRMKHFDVIINFAGEPIIGKRWSKKQKKVIYNSRINTTKDIVKHIENSETPPKVFLTGSAIGIYGDQQDSPLTEVSHTNIGDFASTLCQDWEQSAQPAKGLTRLVALRTGIVLAPNHGALAKMLPAFRFGLGGKIAKGKHYMPWVHIDDYLDAMNFILDNTAISGAVNMTAPNPVTNALFTQILAKVLRRPAYCTIPKSMLFCLLGESANIMLNSHRVIPEKLEKSGFKFKYTELKDALTELL